MKEIITIKQRISNSRRKPDKKRELWYLNEGLAGLPGVRKGTAEKRIRDSSQPMTTAKVLAKEWHGRRRAAAAKSPVDDRAALIRTAYAMELGHGWPAGDQADCICRESLALANRFYRETYLQP